MSWRILQGDWIDVLRTMPSESVHCSVSSPPYWGLRDYGVEGQLGLERSPEEFVEKMVLGFRELRRVLRADGTLWLNLGDGYCTDGGFPTPGRTARVRTTQAGAQRHAPMCQALKQKDLVGMPWRVAFALQADGWWLRSDIIWSKPNPMPESVTDRPTKAHEYLFLLSRSADYFYDVEAIKEPVTGNAHARGKGTHPKMAEPGSGTRMNSSFSAAVRGLVATRNVRSVWTIQSVAFPESHFATFPPELPRRCIMAGTSEHGVCSACGAPWLRIVGDPQPAEGEAAGNKQRQLDTAGERSRTGTHLGSSIPWSPTVTPTIGWEPSCKCGGGARIPATVLDPFNGAGTTGLVATRLGRSYVGIELNPEYVAMSRRRIDGDAPLFNRASEAAS